MPNSDSAAPPATEPTPLSANHHKTHAETATEIKHKTTPSHFKTPAEEKSPSTHTPHTLATFAAPYATKRINPPNSTATTLATTPSTYKSRNI